MKGYHILVIAGVLLAVFGTYSVSQSFPSVNRDSDVTISPGPYYYVLKLNAFSGLSIAVHYVLESTGTVDVHVLSEAQYAIFATSYTAPYSMYEETNRTLGTFTFVFPASAPYYVTFSHHEGVTGDMQTMHLTVVAEGTNGLFLVGGLGMIVLAAVLAAVAWVRRKASKRAFRGPPRSEGQILYKPRGRR